MYPSLSTTDNRVQKIFFWLLALLTVAFVGTVTFMYGKEFTTVAILKQTADYPFGGEGPAPWTYQTAARYASFTGSVSLLALCLLSVALWTIIKRRSLHLIFILLLSLLLLIIVLVIGMIGME